MTKLQKNLILGIVVVLIAGAIAYLEMSKNTPGVRQQAQDVETRESDSAIDKSELYEPAKEITTPDGFINTDSISIEELVGKQVVLLDIWTYSCINCQRTLPYLNAWHDKYADKGLTIIGLHTPEFDFEKDYDNVAAAVEKFDIEYPVVLDNDYSTWRAYNNRYWPRKYLIDIDGYVVYNHIGEGAYEETERKIQQLLIEREEALGEDLVISESIAEPEGVEEVDRRQRRSPEIYFGAQRNEHLGNGRRFFRGVQAYTLPENPMVGALYFGGTWDVTDEFVENTESQDAAIMFRYRAQKVFFVAGTDGDAVQVEALIDDEPVPESMRGEDLYEQDGKTYFDVSEETLYRVIADSSGYAEHTLELRPQQTGLQAFTFTFG